MQIRSLPFDLCKSKFAFFHIFEYFEIDCSVRQRHSVIDRNHNSSLRFFRFQENSLLYNGVIHYVA